MKITQKPIWNFTVRARHQTATRSHVTVRDVEMTIDEPVDRGGTNLGPMPVEMVMAGLAGCSHVITHKLAAHHGVTIADMDIEVVTTMDSRGTRLIEPIDVPFPKVMVNITATMDGSAEAIDAVTSSLKHHCAVSKMLQMSGSEVIENWTVNGVSRAAA